MIKELFDKVLSQALSRLTYEAERVSRVLPTLVRLGVSEAEELYHRFNHWRGACEHPVSRRRPARKTKKVRRRSKKST